MYSERGSKRRVSSVREALRRESAPKPKRALVPLLSDEVAPVQRSVENVVVELKRQDAKAVLRREPKRGPAVPPTRGARSFRAPPDPQPKWDEAEAYPLATAALARVLHSAKPDVVFKYLEGLLKVLRQEKQVSSLSKMQRVSIGRGFLCALNLSLGDLAPIEFANPKPANAVEPAPTPVSGNGADPPTSDLTDDEILDRIRSVGTEYIGPAKLDELGIGEDTVERLVTDGRLREHPTVPGNVGLAERAGDQAADD